MLHKVMVKKLGMVLLAVSASALLSGCLVEQKDPEDVVKISRSTDTLRIYKAGDYIDYDVTAVINTQTSTTIQYGTLHIKWDNAGELTNPTPPTDAYPVLKETSTLTYDGNTEPDAEVIRYISQVTTAPVDFNDPGIGSIILHAIDEPVDDTDYWPYLDGDAVPTSPVIRPVIFESPLYVGRPPFPASYSIMECNTGQCAQEIYNFTDTNFAVVGETQEVTTDLGIFSDPFELSFSGGIIPDTSAPAISFIGDIRDVCGTSTEIINHTGNMFVVPEIGMIKMDNTCSNASGENVIYTITLSDTSVY